MAAKHRSKAATTDENNRTLVNNRRARHDYAILEEVEAGIVLRGSEVKSLRAGLVQVADAYARCEGGEMWLEGLHISPYAFATSFGAHTADRRRKLLLHRDQIDKLQARVAQERLTLIPLKLYLRDGKVKVELGLGKGRQKADKRQTIAERDSRREIERELGRRRKGTG